MTRFILERQTHFCISAGVEVDTVVLWRQWWNASFLGRDAVCVCYQAPYEYRVVVTHFSSLGVNRIVLLPVVLLLFKDAQESTWKHKIMGWFFLQSDLQSDGKMRSWEMSTCGRDLTKIELWETHLYPFYPARTSPGTFLGTLLAFKLIPAKFNSRFEAPAPQKTGDKALRGVEALYSAPTTDVQCLFTLTACTGCLIPITGLSIWMSWCYSITRQQTEPKFIL